VWDNGNYYTSAEGTSVKISHIKDFHLNLNWHFKASWLWTHIFSIIYFYEGQYKAVRLRRRKSLDFSWYPSLEDIIESAINYHPVWIRIMDDRLQQAFACNSLLLTLITFIQQQVYICQDTIKSWCRSRYSLEFIVVSTY
jgi:hypothetical protein